MSNTTVSEFAAELNKPAKLLLEQLQSAGIAKSSVQDVLSDANKQQLLQYLKVSHGTEKPGRKKITLTKRSTSEIKQADATGKARTIQVQVRQKRTFVQRDTSPASRLSTTTDSDTRLDATVVPAPEDEAKKQPVALEAPTQTTTDKAFELEKVAPKADNAFTNNSGTGVKAKASVQKAAVKEAADLVAPSSPAVQTTKTGLHPGQTLDADDQASVERPSVKTTTESPLPQPKDTAAKTPDRKKTVVKTDISDTDSPGPNSVRSVKGSADKATPTTNTNDIQERRRKVLDEAQAIRTMVNAPQRVLVAKKPVKPEPPKTKPDTQKLSGTLHKTSKPTGANKPAAGKKGGKPSGKKEVKSEKLSSSWAEEQARKRGLKTRGDIGFGHDGWRSSGKSRDRSRNRSRNRQEVFAAPATVEFRQLEVHVPETITVAELAHKISLKASEVIKQLMTLGQMVTINQPLDQDTAMIVVEELGHKAVVATLDDPEAFTEEEQLAHQAATLPRPPVVTVMGHVDHGKTSLLDYIRRTKVADGEAGGITQHIGAYHVNTPHGMVTFLDTPGHEAFTAMRARGADATDVVILVCAADDGVMPQTKEAIQHAKAAKVPLVVAITKVDKPEANLEKVKAGLIAQEVLPEDIGGDTPFLGVSAKTGQGIDALLEQVLLQAEVLELQAPVDAAAKGLVIEARLDRGRGAVATVLVQSGTLKTGDVVLVGQTYGRIRAMLDETGLSVTTATPSIPVEIQGLSDVPQAGDELMVLADERRAREISTYRAGKFRHTKLARQQAAKLENMFSDIATSDVKNLPIIIKADVQGSQEALAQSLLKLSTDEVRVQIVYAAVGGISESDINLALASKAVVIGFNTRADALARKLAEANGVDIRYHNIIYDTVNELKAAMSGMLAPEKTEEIIGTAEIRQIFRVSKVGTVAGCMVTSGLIRRYAKLRLLRDNVVVFTGVLDSLKRFKDDVREVKEGFECGLNIKGYNEIAERDVLEFFEVRETERAL